MWRSRTYLAIHLLTVVALGCGGDDGSPDGALATGSNLNLQDVSPDGAWLAYTDDADVLFVVDIENGESQELADSVDRARFRGNTLAIFQGIDALGETADAMLIWRPGGDVMDSGALVVPRTVRGSADHIYYEERVEVGSGTKNLFLNGSLVVEEADRERARFSADSSWLVVGSNINAASPVEAFPTGGGAKVTLAADDAANRFQIADDSETVVIAVNESGDVADLATIPAGGGSTEIIVDQGSDNGFTLFGDSLAFLAPNDPQTPTDFGLERIELDGSNRSELVASGVVDIVDTSSTDIVYATAFDFDTEIGTLRVASADGASDRELGTAALSEGFCPDESCYVFFDQLAGADSSGRLQLYRSADDSLTTLDDSAVRSSFMNATTLVFRTDNDELRRADTTTGETTRIRANVSDYEKVPDSIGGDSGRVVYEIQGGSNPGLFIESL